MVAESARSPTISATGSPGRTFSNRKATTRTPNNVGIVASSRLPTSRNTNLGPALAVEDHRNVPALDRWMLRPEINGKPEVKPRRGVIDARVDATIQRLARRLIAWATRPMSPCNPDAHGWRENPLGYPAPFTRRRASVVS